MYCSSVIKEETSESSEYFVNLDREKKNSPFTIIFKIQPFPKGSLLISWGFPESGQMAFCEFYNKEALIKNEERSLMVELVPFVNFVNSARKRRVNCSY